MSNQNETIIDRKYPIAEIFTSPQGEGVFAGTLMTFIRMAGCSVGKKISDREREILSQANPFFQKDSRIGNATPLAVYTEKCCTHDGRPFLCDTDFRTKEVLTVSEILARVPKGVHRICISGGEPLNHDLSPLLDAAIRKGLLSHVETSGTVSIRHGLHFHWLTISPKIGCLPEVLEIADEIKLLVDEGFDLAKAEELLDSIDDCEIIIWVQPINYENRINEENMKRCIDIIQKKPDWRISSQSHKLWGVR